MEIQEQERTLLAVQDLVIQEQVVQILQVQMRVRVNLNTTLLPLLDLQTPVRVIRHLEPTRAIILV